MSAVLGPIHQWMWQKIKLVQSREEALLEALYEKFGDDAAALAGKPRPSSLPPKPEVPLGELIGEYNIHYWLNNAIQETETSEAKLVTDFIAKYGDEALEVIRRVFREEGRKSGETASVDQEMRRSTARGGYELLNSVMLDGMPCDQVTAVPEAGDARAVLLHSACNHLENWKAAKADVAVMCRLNGEWVAGVMEAINPNFSHAREAAIALGQSQCKDVFTLAAK